MPGPGIRMNKVTIPIMIAFVLFFMYMIWFSENSEKKSVSTPPMPESKSESPVKSPVLEKALRPADLIRKLRQEGIEIKIVDNSIFLDGNTVKDFLGELYADEDAKKIFRQFGQAHIYIFLSNEYAIMNGYVRIRCKDGAKTTAKWLATGKIK